MAGRKWMRYLILALALTLPLIWCGDSFAESGCHRSGGGTKVEPPKP